MSEWQAQMAPFPLHLRRLIAGSAVVALGATLAGCGEETTPEDGAQQQEQPADATDAELPSLPSPDEGREQLAELTVGEEGPMDGYSRDKFPHWLQEDGCTVRQQVLLRDGEDVETDDNCQPQSGEWLSPFDNETLTDASDIDIDHIVPLANAWRTGADEWDVETRKTFANDLDHPQLLAVSASANRSKGDQNPAEWQPVEEYWCSYGLAWTATKHTYELLVTEEEHQMLEEMLDTCS